MKGRETDDGFGCGLGEGGSGVVRVGGQGRG